MNPRESLEICGDKGGILHRNVVNDRIRSKRVTCRVAFKFFREQSNDPLLGNGKPWRPRLLAAQACDQRSTQVMAKPCTEVRCSDWSRIHLDQERLSLLVQHEVKA